jgi:hypothetical protein
VPAAVITPITVSRRRRLSRIGWVLRTGRGGVLPHRTMPAAPVTAAMAIRLAAPVPVERVRTSAG